MEKTTRTIDWDSIYVSVFPRISSKTVPGATYTQRKQDYNESHKTPKEITLWQFLDLWKEYHPQIEAIRNEPDKEKRKHLKSTTIPAATICATFHTREGSVELCDRIKHYNSLVVIDLDNITDIDASRQKVQQLPYVLYCATSVSGNGLYAIIPAKGVTAAKSRGRKYIRNRGYGGAARTSAQAAVKSVFKSLTQNWKNLSNQNILAWNALAQTQAGKSVLGTASKISGANLYTRLNYWIIKCGGAALATPPTLVGVDAPVEADLDLSADSFTFQLPDLPEDTANLRLVIMASAPQSNGISRAYSKAVQIGEPREIVDTAIDLKADYEAVHGAVTEAAPKVFLKYFFVNTATGEKSGEMLGIIRLSAAAQAGE